MNLSTGVNRRTLLLLLSLSAVSFLSLTARTAQSPHYSQPSVSTTLEISSQNQKPTMLKIERLALAIMEHEGWMYPGSKNYPNGSRSYRNHNPGNLRSSVFQVGTDGGFAVFKTDADGFAALVYDLTQKAKGNTRTGLNGNSTISQLINVWAPASDGNNPASYVQHVCQITGFTPETTLGSLLE